MVLQRRTPRTPAQHLREMAWPSMGLKRLARYYKHRMARLPGTPYSIASGFAAGVAVSFTPFMGFHLVMGAAVNWLMRGSFIAMAVGTLVGNPWTFPAIWLVSYKIGKFMMGEYLPQNAAALPAEHVTLSNMLEKPFELLLPMTIGSIPLALLGWLLSFYLVFRAVSRAKRARAARIQKKSG